MPISPQDVVNAYRFILGREPENAGVIAQHCAGHDSFDSLRRSFLGSEEVAHQLAAPPSLPETLPLDVPPLHVETQADASLIEAVIRQTAAYWEKVGVEAPHWSVLTEPDYRPDRIRDTEAQFYATGKGDLDVLTAVLRRLGREPADFRRVLEFGCGVGRLTSHLARCFAEVKALDISAPHLALARDYMRRTAVGNVAFHQVTADNLHPGGGFDLWFCRIVLQHNPPPVIYKILDLMFRKLEPGGVAVFQVPTYRVGYRFEIEAYLNGSLGQQMEMHVLPQPQVLELGWRHRCRLAEMREDTPVVANSPEWLSNTFVFCKD